MENNKSWAEEEFDSAISGIVRFGEFVQKKAEANEIIGKITKMENECGSCYHWMKTSQCPREAHHKVSCGERKCDKFQMDNWHKDFIDQKKERYNELIVELKAIVS